MIESCYWKQDLLVLARRLRSGRKAKRITEKQAVLFEKDLMTAFFWIRKLIEAHKTSSKTRTYRAKAYLAPRTKNKRNLVNLHDVDTLYNFGKEKRTDIKIDFIANQFIHSFTIYPYREPGKYWSGVIVCSDFQKEKGLLRIEISELSKIFEVVGSDRPHSVITKYDNKGEIVIKTN